MRDRTNHVLPPHSCAQRRYAFDTLQLDARRLTGHWPVLDERGATLMTITSIVVSPADHEHRECGLLAFVEIEVDGLLEVDGITLRRVSGGRLSLSFPARSTRRGSRHHLVRPRDRAARAAIEHAVLHALGVREEVAS